MLFSVMLAFAWGMALGARQASLSGSGNPHAIAGFVYRSVGATMTGSVDWALNLASISSRAAGFRGGFQVYLFMPYQFCAFAGAYAATVGLGFTEHSVALAKTYL